MMQLFSITAIDSKMTFHTAKSWRESEWQIYTRRLQCHTSDCQKLQLPNVDNDADISYACWKTSERLSILASTCLKHNWELPSVESSDDPPHHTVVLQADIREAPHHKTTKNKTSSKDSPLPYVQSRDIQTVSCIACTRESKIVIQANC